MMRVHVYANVNVLKSSSKTKCVNHVRIFFSLPSPSRKPHLFVVLCCFLGSFIGLYSIFESFACLWMCV